MFEEDSPEDIATKIQNFQSIILGWEKRHLPEDYQTIEELTKHGEYLPLA